MRINSITLNCRTLREGMPGGVFSSFPSSLKLYNRFYNCALELRRCRRKIYEPFISFHSPFALVSCITPLIPSSLHRLSLTAYFNRQTSSHHTAHHHIIYRASESCVVPREQVKHTSRYRLNEVSNRLNYYFPFLLSAGCTVEKHCFPAGPKGAKSIALILDASLSDVKPALSRSSSLKTQIERLGLKPRISAHSCLASSVSIFLHLYDLPCMPCDTASHTAEETDDLAFDASAADVKAALEALTVVGTVDVTREDGDANDNYAWQVTFTEPVLSAYSSSVYASEDDGNGVIDSLVALSFPLLYAGGKEYSADGAGLGTLGNGGELNVTRVRRGTLGPLAGEVRIMPILQTMFSHSHSVGDKLLGDRNRSTWPGGIEG